MYLFIQFISFALSITIIASDKLNLNINDVEVIQDNSLEYSVRIEDDGRNLLVPDSNTELIKEIALLLSKFKSPPQKINEIVKDIVKEIADVDKKETEEEMLRSGKVSFIVFFIENLDKVELDVDKKVIANIYLSTDKQKAKELDVQFPGVYGYYAPDNVEYKLPFTTFTKAISTILCPIFGELTVDTLKLYDDSELPKFFVFYDEEKNFYEERKEYIEVLKKYKETIKAGILPYKKEKQSLNHFGVTIEALPVVVCVVDKKKYREINLTPQKLSEMLEKYKSNTLEPYELTGEEPKDNDTRNVKEITRNSYKKYFYLEDADKTEENDKDALIVFTSPYCRYCIDLKPIVEKVGELVKLKAEEFVVVGNINLTQNDFPEFTVTGYPTIALVANKEVHYYSGSRTVDDLCEFIKEKGFYNIDIKTGEKIVKTSSENAENKTGDEKTGEKIDDKVEGKNGDKVDDKTESMVDEKKEL
ncbi:protein disulfide-isomerase precursor [Binucleata daphniae]